MLEAKHAQSTSETTTTHEILTHVVSLKIAQYKKPIYWLKGKICDSEWEWFRPLAIARNEQVGLCAM